MVKELKSEEEFDVVQWEKENNQITKIIKQIALDNTHINSRHSSDPTLQDIQNIKSVIKSFSLSFKRFLKKYNVIPNKNLPQSHQKALQVILDDFKKDEDIVEIKKNEYIEEEITDNHILFTVVYRKTSLQ